MAMIWEQMAIAFADGGDAKTILQLIALNGLETPPASEVIGNPEAEDPGGEFVEEFSQILLAALTKVIRDQNSTEDEQLEAALIATSAAMRAGMSLVVPDQRLSPFFRTAMKRKTNGDGGPGDPPAAS